MDFCEQFLCAGFVCVCVCDTLVAHVVVLLS
jgi:hypothetical protein